VNKRYANSYADNEGKINYEYEPWIAIQSDASAFIKDQGCGSKTVSQLIENYYRLIEQMPSLQAEAVGR
jgi:hypothetical protein